MANSKWDKYIVDDSVTEKEPTKGISKWDKYIVKDARTKALETVDPGQILYRQKTSGDTSFTEKETRKAAERQIKEGEEEFAEATAPKDLFKAVGAEITPEMEQAQPYWSAAAKTAQEGIAIPVLHYSNQLLLNLPRSLLAKAGITIPESKTLSGKILARGAGIAGAVGSPITKAILGGQASKTLGKQVIRGFRSPTTLGKVSRGAARGATLGALYSPEEFTDIKARGKQAAIGAATGAALPIIAKAIKTSWPKSTKGRIKLAEKVRNEMKLEATKSAETLTKRGVTLTNAVDDEMSLLYRDPEVTDVIKTTTTALSKSKAFEQANLTPKEFDALVKYVIKTDSYQKLKGKLETGQLLKNLVKRWGDPEIEKAANKLLGKGLQKEISSYRRNVAGWNAAKFTAKWGSVIAVGGGAVGAAVKAVTGGLLD